MYDDPPSLWFWRAQPREVPPTPSPVSPEVDPAGCPQKHKESTLPPEGLALGLNSLITMNHKTKLLRVPAQSITCLYQGHWEGAYEIPGSGTMI